MKNIYSLVFFFILSYFFVKLLMPDFKDDSKNNITTSSSPISSDYTEVESQSENEIKFTEEEKEEHSKIAKRNDLIIKNAKKLKPEILAKEVYSEVLPILKEGLEMDILRQQDKIECMPIMRRLIPITDDLRTKAEQLPEKYLGLKAITVNLGLCIRCNSSAQEFCDMVSEDLEHLDSNYIWN